MNLSHKKIPLKGKRKSLSLVNKVRLMYILAKFATVRTTTNNISLCKSLHWPYNKTNE